MDTFNKELNKFLVDTFNIILKTEETIIQHENKIPLTISELHLIEAVGNEEPVTISQIANRLNIKLASVTVGVNKLINKGFLKKTPNDNDKRSVYVTLTESGINMLNHHTFFHEQMVNHIESQLTDDEKAIMLILIKRLNGFFIDLKKSYE